MSVLVHALAFTDQGDGVTAPIESKVENPSGDLRLLVTAELDASMLRAVREFANKYLIGRSLGVIYWKNGFRSVDIRKIQGDEVADDLRKAGFSVHIGGR